MRDFHKRGEYNDNVVTTKKINHRPLVYICSPYSGDTSGNTRNAVKYSRFAVDQGVIPLAPHLLLPLYMNEETERELAMSMDMSFLECCEELWCFGSEKTKGMLAEIEEARKLKIKIRYFTADCKEEG